MSCRSRTLRTPTGEMKMPSLCRWWETLNCPPGRHLEGQIHVLVLQLRGATILEVGFPAADFFQDFFTVGFIEWFIAVEALS